MTNYSINKFNSKFEKNRRVDDPEEGVNEEGHKRSVKWFLKHIDNQGHDSSLLWREIKAIALKTICSIQPILKHYYSSLKSNDFWSGCCFEVLGFDILISDRMKPYILEVNASPSFGTDSPLDYEIKSGLVRDTFRLVNFSLKRKMMIIKEERAKLSKRMFTGKREKVPSRVRTQLKCKWIREAEDEMIRQTGGLGNFEKVFGVDEYVDFLEKPKKQGARLNQSCSESFIKKVKGLDSKKTLTKKRVSLTMDRIHKLKKPTEESKDPQFLRQHTLLNEENCLGVENRHKVFEFIRYAELFEKKAHVSRSKRSKIESLLLEDLNLLTENDEMKNKKSLKNVESKKKPKPSRSSVKLETLTSPKIKKHKSCAQIGMGIQPQLRINRENQAFQKLFNWQFYNRKMFLKLKNLCPMVKLVFDLFKFLVDFELREDVTRRINLLKDFRWKRVCFCRLCSYLTKIERSHQFVFVKLNKFLRFYAFPRAKAESSYSGSTTQSNPTPAHTSEICNKATKLRPISCPLCTFLPIHPFNKKTVWTTGNSSNWAQ